MTKSHQILGTLALALVLAACGKSEAPAEAPSAEAAPAPMVEEPKPAEGFTTGAPEPELAAEVPAPAVTAPMPAVVQSPNIAGHEDRRLRKAIAEVPAALIGGAASDITAEQAYDRAFKALYHHLAKKKIPTQSFYLKYNDKQGGFWTYMFFGDPTPGEGMYVHVRVFPDGRAEIVD